MQILQNVSLADHSTMRLGGIAAYSCEIASRAELVEALGWASSQQLPYRVIGSGSNIIWADEGFQGLLIINAIKGFELYDEDEQNSYLTVGAGEPWDSVVERSVAAGLSGIEALSLIPGTAGATPIQNVGAYGQDVSQTVATIEAYDTSQQAYVTIPGFDCGFGYRTSRFNTSDRGRFIITSVTFHLVRSNPLPPYYPAVEHYLTDMHKAANPATIREAVISVRSSKLPDPSIIGNNGSFFANPIISTGDYTQLEAGHGQIPHWEVSEGVKLSGAWLIEQAGFKDFHDTATGMATWYSQPLVLVNEHAKSTADLLAFKQQIVNAVAAKFGVQLEQEPELLP
ncbi:MAG: UDP-N-acetylmuramate dehydrogenase [Patescibacteria group bacterium]|nr:UDP-N-acetylmuramate dehydrogenase [Patescibacteria group bacterium]